ncbi:MAG: DEAD/DEAH box helicase [Pirellulaceae bacterium]|nr:DEAD/DEAH box helicase [Pirellulaceae bacterium]
MSFESLGLDPKILATLQKLKYTVATPIQVASIPAILDGDDLLGCAQTGTGKTAAFSLPILQNLFLSHPSSRASDTTSHESSGRSSNPRRGERSLSRPISVLVLTPTRELANQVSKSFATYGRGLGLRQVVIFGGVSQNPQITALRAGVDIVVATPGRLLDLMGQNVVDLSHVKVLVLDEADQMLDMGFIQPLKKIVSRIPRSRQTLMFSATMPPEIQSLAEQWLNNPITVQADGGARPPEKIKQSVAHVDQSRKADALIEYLRTSRGIRHIVFCRTKHGSDRLVKLLDRAKISAVAIHGNKSQNARERALARFCSEEPPILVATDVAARGLHMPGVSHVINYELPNTPETYVHRIGRTARAGAAGESVSFCSHDEREYLRDIERLIGYSIPVQTMAGFSSAEPIKSEPRSKDTKHSTRANAPRANAPRAKSSSKKPAAPSFAQRNVATRNAAIQKAAAVQAIRTITERPVASPSKKPTSGRAANPQVRQTRPTNSARPGKKPANPSRGNQPSHDDDRPRRSRPDHTTPSSDSRSSRENTRENTQPRSRPAFSPAPQRSGSRPGSSQPGRASSDSRAPQRGPKRAPAKRRP